MSGTTGLEVIAGRRGSDHWTPVILVSAFATPAVVEEAAQLGAAKVFTEPFELGALADTVRALAAGVAVG